MLLNEIITLLGDEKNSLSAALLKTKILLHQIGKKELAEWVNNELNGYPKDAILPDYRILSSEVKANAASIAWQFTDHPIPVSHMNEFFREHFLKAAMPQSLSVLEDLSKKAGASLTRSVPMEYNGELGKALVDGVNIINAWCVTPTHEVKGILTQVRSRLLDFVLELKSSIGDAMSDEEVKKEATKVDAANLFNNAVFGSNTTIMVGSHNMQTAKNTIETGDLSALIKALIDAGIPPDDIKDLQVAIAEDEKSDGKASFEGKTGNWLTRTMSKIAKGSIKLSSEVAGHVIAIALSNYIGVSHS